MPSHFKPLQAAGGYLGTKTGNSKAKNLIYLMYINTIMLKLCIGNISLARSNDPVVSLLVAWQPHD